MSEIRIPAEEFTLHETFLDVPEARLEVQRAVARDPGQVMPFVRATAEDLKALKAALDDDTVEDVVRLTEFDDEWLYRMQ